MKVPAAEITVLISFNQFRHLTPSSVLSVFSTSMLLFSPRKEVSATAFGCGPSPASVLERIFRPPLVERRKVQAKTVPKPVVTAAV